MKMKKRKYAPPKEELIREAISGDPVALYELRSHYEKLMYYKLNREIGKMSEKTDFNPAMFQIEDLMSDLGIIFDNAVMSFKE